MTDRNSEHYDSDPSAIPLGVMERREQEDLITDLRARVGLNEYRDEAILKRVCMLEREIEETFRPGCANLENALADARRDHELLTRLVVRMGEAVAILEWHSNNGQGLIGVSDVPYTPSGQREYDAACHEAEGPDPTRESEGAWGHE